MTVEDATACGSSVSTVQVTTTQSPLFVNFTDDEIRTAQAVRDASDARM